MPRKRKFADGRATVMLKYGIDLDVDISVARQCIRVKTSKGTRPMTLAEYFRLAALCLVNSLRVGGFVPPEDREDELPIAEVLPFPSPDSLVGDSEQAP